MVSRLAISLVDDMICVAVIWCKAVSVVYPPAFVLFRMYGGGVETALIRCPVELLRFPVRVISHGMCRCAPSCLL